jgi:hypothetical protein
MVCKYSEILYPVAKFIVPDWADKVDSGINLSYTGPPGYIGWQAGTTTLSRSQLQYIPHSGTMNLAKQLSSLSIYPLTHMGPIQYLGHLGCWGGVGGGGGGSAEGCQFWLIYDQAFSTWGLEGNGTIYTLFPPGR